MYYPYFSPNNLDPIRNSCVLPCGVFIVKERAIVDHWYVTWDEETGLPHSAGFGPSDGGRVDTCGPNLPSGFGEWISVAGPEYREEYGLCEWLCNHDCDAAKKRLLEFAKASAAKPPGFSGAFYNCHSWAEDAMKAAGLCPCKEEKAPPPGARVRFGGLE